MTTRIAIPHARSQSPEYVARVMPQYAEAVRMAGGEPVQVALELNNHQIARLATMCDAILLPGSRADVNPEKYGAVRDPRTAEDDPLRDNADELLLQDAYNMRKPVLGICFGLQSLNVWRTGTLVQHLATGVTHSGNSHEPAPPHRAVIDVTSRLGDIVRQGLAYDEIGHPERSEGSAFLEITVNTSHHQAVERPGDGLRQVAWCPDDQTIEAVEGIAPDHWVIGVQWHPERMMDDRTAQALMLSFVQAAERWRDQAKRKQSDFEAIV